MLTDWVEGSSQSYTKNPDYWSYDEKYPENRLPYIGKLERLSGGAPGTRPTRSTSAELCIGVSSPVNSKQRQGTADRVGEVYRYLITRLTRRPFLRPVTEHCGLSERTGARGRATLTKNVSRRLALASRAVSNQPRHGRSRARGHHRLGGDDANGLGCWRGMMNTPDAACPPWT